MSVMLRFLFIAMVLVVGVLGLAACAEGLCAECSHLCCSGADRSEPLSHLARKLAGGCGSVTALAREMFATALVSHRPVAASFVPVPALLRASSLRI